MKRFVINEELFEKKGLSKEDRIALEKLYKQLGSLLDKLEEGGFYISPQGIRDQITEIEFKLQEVWRFPKDRDFHKYDFLNKVCRCPKMDNLDVVGQPFRYYSSICPIHSKNDKELLPKK